jgi:hypothetical protein
MATMLQNIGKCSSQLKKEFTEEEFMIIIK